VRPGSISTLAAIFSSLSIGTQMHQAPDSRDGVSYPPGEMINASELREFVFCEHAWWLSRQGYMVSAKAQQQRVAGVTFHERRAGAARRGSNAQAIWWAILLMLAALVLWLAKSFLGMR
jgi:hypothetical protein